MSTNGASGGPQHASDDGNFEGTEVVTDEVLEPGVTVTVATGKYAGSRVLSSLGAETCRLHLVDSEIVTGNLQRTSVVVVNSTDGRFTASPLRDVCTPSATTWQLKRKVTSRYDATARRSGDSALSQAERVAASLKERGLPYEPNIDLLKSQQNLLREQYVKNRAFLDGLNGDSDGDSDQAVDHSSDAVFDPTEKYLIAAESHMMDMIMVASKLTIRH